MKWFVYGVLFVIVFLVVNPDQKQNRSKWRWINNMARKKQPAWQYKFSMALSVVMLFLIAGYFYQSFLEIRKVQPVTVAIEKIQNKN